MQKTFITAFIVFIMVVFFAWLGLSGQEPLPFTPNDAFLTQLTINGTIIKVTVARTPEALERGLGGRLHLEANQGLVLAFGEDDYHGIWMQDMHFPIDIVWFDKEWMVVGVERYVNPNTWPKVFYPQAPARYVLELNAGTTEIHKIEIGDSAAVR
ncbi:hypothetical protein COU17_01475 [Candidatus Kaiserbacteria bacterium CG10_big_fil_rev_8_21_14_0_10_49_17]|uniref:DUF192 domain-containing protein n=1 Tax=Candidatus Kaiserbacteria bacterium CG10_big_fil_rev_8_21_14_0_10_49_17 TaxID=1974609 RepID=A0A2M6WER7_9BACT|nr:MAG: hypothetical protein COU17_01475 [Candidatus Kaiserbacteria bacterium CG10_big_fil_rev_8_21_14_0_10_49_17]